MALNKTNAQVGKCTACNLRFAWAKGDGRLLDLAAYEADAAARQAAALLAARKAA